jgi:AcrR family transcriptional regulator
MPKASNTKEQILDLAEHFMMSRGYNGFSYKDIASELNVKNAAIHYHFPSKKDLGVAVIERAQARFNEWDAMTANQRLSPVDMLNQSLETYLGYLNSDKYVCLGGSLETDFHTLPEEMQKEVRKYTSKILTWMRNLLSKGREEGQFNFSGPSEDKAFFIIASIQGALQIARVSDKELFYRTVDRLKSELGI